MFKTNTNIIRTINDDDDVPVYSEDSDEEVEVKLQPKKKRPTTTFSSDFQFEAINDKSENTWDDLWKYVKRKDFKQHEADLIEIKKESDLVNDSDSLSEDELVEDRISTKERKKRKRMESEIHDEEVMGNINSEEVMNVIESNTEKDLKNFHEMNLSRLLLKAVMQMDYLHPTPIQAATIPVALLGKDIYGCAATGTGKTAAYMLPVLERLIYRPTRGPAVTRVLVLVPTRELGVQVYQVAKQLAQFTNIEIGLSVGGLDVKVQETVLRKNPDIVISTPGRLIDHLRNAPNFSLDSIDVLIIDEADRILDENFSDQLNEIIKQCSYTRQTMLFSATMSNKVKDLATVSLKNPVKIFVNTNQEVALNLHQEFIRIRDDNQRDAYLASLVCRTFRDHCIIFVDMKKEAHRLATMLSFLGLRVEELHGDLTQVQRLQALKKFKEEQINFLVATDVAARGIDIQGVKTVINYKMPRIISQYIHRVGRTARAGRVGVSVSLVGSKSEINWAKEVIKSAKNPVQNRTISPKVIKKYQIKLDLIADKIDNKLKNDLAEKLLNEQEKKIEYTESAIMKKSKDLTMAEHKRTWFQTKKERREKKKELKLSHREKMRNKIRKKVKPTDNDVNPNQLKNKIRAIKSKNKKRKLSAYGEN